MNYRLYPARNGLAEYPLDKTENYLAAVERGYGQKVENGEIDPYICRNFQKTLHPLRGELGSQLYGGDGPAHRAQADIARYQLAQHLEDGARDFERIGKRPANACKEGKAVALGAYHPIRVAVPAHLGVYSERRPQAGGIGRIFEYAVLPQGDGNLRELTSALHGEVCLIARELARKRLHQVGGEVNPFALRLYYHVARDEAVRGVVASLVAYAVYADNHLPEGEKGDYDKNYRRHVVHKRARNEHDYALPRRH